MARKEDVPHREKEICWRLREFRETTRIPRTTFALSIGISSERMASYELARVPVRYEIFKAVNAQYLIRLDWLMNRRGPPIARRPYDDSKFADQINKREKLSVIYDEILSRHADPDKEDVQTFFFGPGGLEARLMELRQIVTNPKDSRELPSNLLPLFIDQIEDVLIETKKAVERDLPQEEKYARAMKSRLTKQS